ncbi:MAG: peptidase [Bacteroidota bacterium]|jgi:tripeptide aminopeptidase
MSVLNIQHTVTERFMRYVQIDTQSDPNSSTQPSTEKQKNLSRILVNELQAMGVTDAHLDEFGYVYATIPSTTEKKNVPTICFCSHVDTSPDCSGANVKLIIHKNYNGEDIILPDDTSQIIRLSDYSSLQKQIGNDIITASGTTLLGADNKAGVAEIMDAAYFLMQNPQIKHGEIKILFTPDEEIGRGVDKVNLEKLNANFAYTIDGEELGSLEDETFSADAVIIKIEGVSTHPGFALNKLESAIKIAADIVALLPKDRLSPETTSNKEGFLHPVSLEAHTETAQLSFIVRDFDTQKLAEHELFLKNIMETVLKNYPNSKATFTVKEQYRNMKEVLKNYPQVSDYALSAIKRAGLTPIPSHIRGGTDGSRLSFMGLPCPNIFAGEHAFHSKHEWVSVQDMQKAVETIIYLSIIWEENA